MRTAAVRRRTIRDAVRPSGIRPSGIRPSGIRPSGIRPSGIRPSGIRPSGIRPSGIRPSGITAEDHQGRCCSAAAACVDECANRKDECAVAGAPPPRRYHSNAATACHSRGRAEPRFCTCAVQAHTRARRREQTKHPPAGPLPRAFVGAQNQVPVGVHRGHARLRQQCNAAVKPTFC